MAVIRTVYGRVNLHMIDGTMLLDDDHLKVLLVTSGYVLNQDTHEFLSDITGEVAGTGYTAGGVACTSVSASYDASSNSVTLDCDDPMFVNVTLPDISGAVFYSDTGTPGTSPLFMHWAISPGESSVGSDYVLLIPAEGLAVGTVS